MLMQNHHLEDLDCSQHVFTGGMNKLWLVVTAMP